MPPTSSGVGCPRLWGFSVGPEHPAPLGFKCSNYGNSGWQGGKWDSEPDGYEGTLKLTCTKAECEAELPPHAQWTSGDCAQGDHVVVGTVCGYSCMEGYFPSSGREGPRTCRSGGDWSEEDLVCTAHGSCPRATGSEHSDWVGG